MKQRLQIPAPEAVASFASFTVKNWCERYLVAQTKTEKEMLLIELSNQVLIRDEIVFLITAFHKLDVSVIEVLYDKEPKEQPISLNDIFATINHRDWDVWLQEYFREFRKRHPRK